MKHPLAAWREGAGLTQTALATDLGVSRWTVNSIETGRREASLALVERIVARTDRAVTADQIRPDLKRFADLSASAQ
jgi:DNA-binding XRE family transcriptional regulator